MHFSSFNIFNATFPLIFLFIFTLQSIHIFHPAIHNLVNNIIGIIQDCFWFYELFYFLIFKFLLIEQYNIIFNSLSHVPMPGSIILCARRVSRPWDPVDIIQIKNLSNFRSTEWLFFINDLPSYLLVNLTILLLRQNKWIVEIMCTCTCAME